MLSNLLRRLRGVSFAPPCPDQPLAIIGDVHGCLDLLRDLLTKLPTEAQIILVGDYIDRGEDSAGVLRYLADHPDLICLRGNHEDMLLRFLADPARHGARWLHHGGLQTLASFKVSGLTPSAPPEALITCRDALLAAMGDDLLASVKAFLPSYHCGNVLVTHAGANPAVAPEYQPPEVLAWGHDDFHKVARQDGVWVVHGHVIQEEPQARQGRIAIDTGAYATGCLTAVLLTPGAEPRFMSTQR